MQLSAGQLWRIASTMRVFVRARAQEALAIRPPEQHVGQAHDDANDQEKRWFEL